MNQKLLLSSLPLFLLISCGEGVAPVSYVSFDKELAAAPAQEMPYGQRQDKDYFDVAEIQKTYRPNGQSLEKATSESKIESTDDRGAKTYKAQIILDEKATLDDGDKTINNHIAPQGLYSFERKLKIYTPYVSHEEWGANALKIHQCEWIGFYSTVQGIEFKFKTLDKKLDSCRTEVMDLVEALGKSGLLRFQYWHLLNPAVAAVTTASTEFQSVQLNKFKTRLVRKTYRVDPKILEDAFYAADVAREIEETVLVIDMKLDPSAVVSPNTLRLNKVPEFSDWKQSIYDPASQAVGNIIGGIALLPFEVFLTALGARPEAGKSRILEPFRFDVCNGMKVSTSLTGVHFKLDAFVNSDPNNLEYRSKLPECIDEVKKFVKTKSLRFDYTEERL